MSEIGMDDELVLVPQGERPEYFTFSSLAKAGVVSLTTTRHCPEMGTALTKPSPFGSDVSEVLARAGLSMERVAWGRQVHRADVARVDAGGLAGDVDVLVTATPGVPLAIFTADCLAIVLVDVDAPALAVAHVGWRGTVRGATQAAVAAVVAAGARVERLRTAISPSIGPCCYEVDVPVTDAFAAAYPDRWRAWIAPTARPTHVMLDLWSANAALLEQAGLDPRSIENPRLCTACHTDLLYSYRKGHKGRLATLAALPS
jgi:YfiH family protein